MLLKSIKTQMRIIFNQKLFAIAIVVIYLFIIINFYRNINIFWGADVTSIVHPVKISILNTYGKWGFYFMQYLPIIIVFPAAFSFLKDKDNGTITYMCARFGNKNYYYGKIVSVFLMTFLAFFVPLVFEYLLNVISFPISSIGDWSNLSSFDQTYLDMEKRYIFSNIWRYNPFVYYFVFIFFFSFVVASFATFATAFSMIPIIKFKVFVILLVYLLMSFFNVLGTLVGMKLDYSYYLMSFDSSHKIDTLYITIALTLLFASLIISKLRINKEI